MGFFHTFRGIEGDFNSILWNLFIKLKYYEKLLLSGYDEWMKIGGSQSYG